jgi:hypothetical protein
MNYKSLVPVVSSMNNVRIVPLFLFPNQIVYGTTQMPFA